MDQEIKNAEGNKMNMIITTYISIDQYYKKKIIWFYSSCRYF